MHSYHLAAKMMDEKKDTWHNSTVIFSVLLYKLVVTILSQVLSFYVS